jgi:hypothetical protein
MRKQLRLLVLFLVSAYTLFFSCGALSAASPQVNFSSDYPGKYVPDSSLVADFGALGGLCRYRPGSPNPLYGWSQLAAGSPSHMISTTSMLIANFPGFGLYEHNGTAWNHITQNDSVESLLQAPRLYPPQGLVYADYGSLGIWQYEVDTGNWSQITAANPDKMQADGWSGLYANFPGDGLYYYSLSTWYRLTPNSSVENFIGGILELFADFGSLGLWKNDAWGAGTNAGSTWHNLSYSNPNKMLLYRSATRLIANFPGYGLYEYNNYWYSDDYNTWHQLTPNDTVQALFAVSTDSDAFYADFGDGGLWKYSSLGWEQITVADANMLGSYGDTLVANFPCCGGLYQYIEGENGSYWELLSGNSGVTKMLSVNLP